MVVERPYKTQYCRVSTDSRATWCKGGCGKFRYPYAVLGSSPICVECSVRLGLKPNTYKSHATYTETIKSENCDHKHVPQNFHSFAARACLHTQQSKKPRRKVLEVGQRFINALLNGPRSSVELANTLNHTQLWITITGRRLVKEGKILMVRECSTRACCWYALPEYKELLMRKSGQQDSDFILAALKKHGPCQVKDFVSIIPDLHKSTIKRRLITLVKTQGVIAYGSSHLRLYGLPEHYSKIQQLLIEQQPRKKIIDLLRQHPHLWSMEIWRRLEGKIPQKTLLWHLRQLVDFGVLVASDIKGSRARKLYAVSPTYQFSDHNCIQSSENLF